MYDGGANPPLRVITEYAPQTGCSFVFFYGGVTYYRETVAVGIGVHATYPLELHRAGCGAVGSIIHRERVRVKAVARWRFEDSLDDNNVVQFNKYS